MFIKITLIIVLAQFLFSCATKDEPVVQSTPNFLILIADDAGWRDFGCYGNPYIRTPNIDALARSGMKANNAFLTAPQCSPSRISILSGKYAHATGAEDLHMPLPDGEILLTTLLKQEGYFTGILKKKHLGLNGDKQFDYYSQDLDHFSAFLDSAGQSPFFMWVGFSDPHRPYEKGIIDNPQNSDSVIVPPYLLNDQDTRDDLADYYNEIRRMDQKIGEYLTLLKQRNKSENTLIIFLSDNGAPFPRAKGTLYDSGIKTPLIFSWPGQIKQGIEYDHLMSVIDLAPTVLDIAGIEIPDYMQGASVKEIINNPSLPGREYIYSERNWHNCDEHMRCLRTDRFKFITNAYTDLPHGTPSDLSMSPSWKSLKNSLGNGRLTPIQKMLFKVPRPEEELYDIQNDPYESQNLIENASYQDIASELRRQLELWERQTDDFSPDQRRRQDNTDRFTGVKFDQTRLPPRVK